MGSFVVRQQSGREFEVLVDDEDLDWVLAAGHWYVNSRRRNEVHSDQFGVGWVKLHRFVLGLKAGDPIVDHRNGDPLDCRKGNLVLSTTLDNCANQAAEGGRGSSRYRGVTYLARTGRWKARQKINYHEHHIGYFSTEAEAAAALARFRAEHGLPTHR